MDMSGCRCHRTSEPSIAQDCFQAMAKVVSKCPLTIVKSSFSLAHKVFQTHWHSCTWKWLSMAPNPVQVACQWLYVLWIVVRLSDFCTYIVVPLQVWYYKYSSQRCPASKLKSPRRPKLRLLGGAEAEAAAAGTPRPSRSKSWNISASSVSEQ